MRFRMRPWQHGRLLAGAPGPASAHAGLRPAMNAARPELAIVMVRRRTSGVVHLPGGAHPSSCAPLYGFDVKHFKEYVASSKEEGGWSEYQQKYVQCTEQEYLEKVGGMDAIKRLPLPVF